VLNELEILMPTYCCTINRHVTLHLPEFIERCGPFHVQSMLPFERWHTFFKKLFRSRKSVLKSIENHYAMACASMLWRAPSQRVLVDPVEGGDAVVMPVTHATPISEELPINYIIPDVFIQADEGYKHGKLPPADYKLVLRCWANKDEHMHSLLEKHNEEVGHEQAMASGWCPAGGLDTLTSEERSRTQVTPDVRFLTGARVNAWVFRTEQSQANCKTDNAGVKVWYVGSNGQLEPAYGKITSIIQHELYPDGPREILFAAEWYQLIDGKSETGLTRVKRNPQHHWNRTDRYHFLRDIVPYNIALLSQKPLNESDTYAVIDPSVKYGEKKPLSVWSNERARI
jgi:hypothetical protein